VLDVTPATLPHPENLVKPLGKKVASWRKHAVIEQSSENHLTGFQRLRNDSSATLLQMPRRGSTPAKESREKRKTRARWAGRNRVLVENGGRGGVLIAFPDSEATARIVQSVSIGVPIRVALQAEGISESIFARWALRYRDEGEEGGPYTTYFGPIARAQALAIRNHVATITGAAAGRVKGDWRASAFWLRCMVHEFRDSAQVDVGLVSGSSSESTAKATLEMLRRLAGEDTDVVPKQRAISASVVGLASRR